MVICGVSRPEGGPRFEGRALFLALSGPGKANPNNLIIHSAEPRGVGNGSGRRLRKLGEENMGFGSTFRIPVRTEVRTRFNGQI